MQEDLKKVLESVPQLPQRQDGIDAQLQDLRVIANRLGMYDAADVLRSMVERKPS